MTPLAFCAFAYTMCLAGLILLVVDAAPLPIVVAQAACVGGTHWALDRMLERRRKGGQ